MPYYVPMAARKNPRKRSATTLAAELRWLLLALATGLLLLPGLLWLTGRALLGNYANGGLLALWLDFAKELANGSVAAWILAVSPYALLLAARFALLLHRKLG
jgi:hypothetical protein